MEIVKNIEAALLPLFTTKAPFQLPEIWKDGIVKYGPWVMLIFAPLSILAIGLGSIAGIFSLFTVNFLAAVSLLLTLIAIVLDLLAIKPLFDTKLRGWNLVFLSWLINLVAAVIDVNLFGLVLSFLLGGFFLFQVREKYS